MNEQSYIAKIIHALELAKAAQTGCTLTYFDVIELLGHIKLLEEEIALDAVEITDLKNLIIEAASQFNIDKKGGTFENSVMVLIRLCSMGAEAMINISALEEQLAAEKGLED